MRRLFFPGYYSGYSNIKMSLDIGVVLAHLTGRMLVPYRFRMPRRQAQSTTCTDVHEPMLVPELFEIPVPYSAEALLKTWVSTPGAAECAWPALFDAVFRLPGQTEDSEGFQAFRNGRQHVLSLTAAQQQANDLHIRCDALTQYAHFFFLDDSRRRDIVELMRRLRPRAAYRQSANAIAATLGRFNAIHLRRGDFLFNDLSRRGIIRSRSVSGQEIVANLAPRMRRDDPLLICTDGDPQEDLFGPIVRHFRHTVFLDQYLRANAAARAALQVLPRYDEDVDALITQLVASRAEVFAGNMFSTFTALIHRARALERGEVDFLYCYDDFRTPIARFENGSFLPTDTGPFTWNRLRYPVSADAYAWMRDWPECAGLSIAGLAPDDVVPAGAVTLLAVAGVRCGAGLQLEERPGLPAMITNWNDADACVTWRLETPLSRLMEVQIRYACPFPDGTGRYQLGIVGELPLRARTWSTGSWTNVSPWLPLGRLQLPAGSSTLEMRPEGEAPRQLPGLVGIRLFPI